MKRRIYVTYEIRSSRNMIVDAYGMSDDVEKDGVQMVLKKIEQMMKKSYPDADSIEVKKIFIEESNKGGTKA